MDKRKFFPAFSVPEAFLPLLFFSDNRIFIAAALVPCVAGLSLAWLELLRKQPSRLTDAFYGAWLAACGFGAWYGLGLAPYWIWSAHLLIPETARQPSAAQKKKPFLFGFKKYTARRAREFILILMTGLVAGGGMLYLRTQAGGVIFWPAAILALLIAQLILSLVRKEKA